MRKSPIRKPIAITRRELLRTAGATAMGFSIVPRHVRRGAGFTPPGAQLTKAMVGVGNMGSGHFGLAGSRTLAQASEYYVPGHRPAGGRHHIH